MKLIDKLIERIIGEFAGFGWPDFCDFDEYKGKYLFEPDGYIVYKDIKYQIKMEANQSTRYLIGIKHSFIAKTDFNNALRIANKIMSLGWWLVQICTHEIEDSQNEVCVDIVIWAAISYRKEFDLQIPFYLDSIARATSEYNRLLNDTVNGH